ncbi:Transposase IS4 [Popillia japonica]|uniref:Transposase IS4 n=1 Tax=Popillia japonica TaxID=7064 RepID=A0AAW1N4F8_POPJA
MKRGESDYLVSNDGILATRWNDTKEVLLMSNCHRPTPGIAKRILKTGKKTDIDCSDAIMFYNKFMGGVDLADQKVSTYDLDRKSTKWWRKVFYKLLMSAIVNSWIIFNEIKNKKSFLLCFLVPLAEQLIELGRSGTKIKRRLCGRSGRHSKRRKEMANVGDHLPQQIGTRRRCYRCSQMKKEIRTKTICVA